MLILDTTTRKLEVVLAGAITTNQLPCVASWVDIQTSAFTPGATVVNTNSTTAVTLVGSPAASTQRQLKFLSIYNADTVAATVTVRYNDNGTLYKIQVVTLQVGDTLNFTDSDGWSVINSSGQIKDTASSPTPIAARVFNSAAISLTTATLTALTFDSERRNDGGLHSTSSNTSRLTAPIASWYQISGTVEFASNATGRRELNIRLNGTTYLASIDVPSIGAIVQELSVTTLYYLNVNDYVELVAFQTSGGNLNVDATANFSPEFMMALVH